MADTNPNSSITINNTSLSFNPSMLVLPLDAASFTISFLSGGWINAKFSCPEGIGIAKDSEASLIYTFNVDHEIFTKGGKLTVTITLNPLPGDCGESRTASGTLEVSP